MMSHRPAGVVPAHWRYTDPVDCGPVEVAAGRLEDVFDAWVFAARDAELALMAWLAARRADRGEAFAVYHAALEREERAATVLGARAARDPRCS